MTNVDRDDISVLEIPLPDGRVVFSVMDLDASGVASHRYRVMGQDGVPRDFFELEQAAKFLDAEPAYDMP